MALVPKAVFFNGCRGMFFMLLNLPLFLALYLVIFALSVIPLAINIVKCIVCCRRFGLGRDYMNPMFVGLECVWTIALARNPCCPKGVMANCGKWLHAIMAVLVYCIGKCFDCCRRRGASDNVPSVDGDHEVIKIDERVTVVNAKFIESLESTCTMTVIKHDNYVIFWNPVFAPKNVYEELAAGSERVIVFINTMYHHMSTQIALAACPCAEVWGCGSAEGRHPKPLNIKDPTKDGLCLKGVTFYHLPGTIYDEWWMYFEPSKFLGLGDFVPGIEDSIFTSSISIGLNNCVHCGDPSPMLSYSRSLVIDHAGTAEVVKEVLKLELSRMDGAHKPNVHNDPHDTLAAYWSWLVPVTSGLKENLV